MVKHSKNRILTAIMLLITVAFTILQFQDCAFLRSRYNAVSIRLNKDGITEQRIAYALKGLNSRGATDIPEVTAWIRCDQAEINNDFLNRSIRITPTIVSGDMGLVSPMNVISGNLVYKSDKRGCVIDSDTAYELFGSEKAEGNLVEYRDKSYYVRGVVKSKYPLFLIQGAETEIEYTNLELLFQNKERGEAFAQDFMYQNALGTDFIIIDGYFYSRIISAVLSIPLWIFFLVVAVLAFRRYVRNEAKLKLPIFLIFGLIGMLTITGYGVILNRYVGMPFYFPEKLIPTKWSDFDYWSRQFDIIKEQIFQMRFLTPNPKDILLVDALTKLPYRFGLNIGIYFILFLSLVYRFLVRKPATVNGIKTLQEDKQTGSENETERLTA